MSDGRRSTTPAVRQAHCPACHRTVRPTPIVWGLPSHVGFEAAERGEVVLGGCLVSPFDPSHVCPECSTRLYETPNGEFEVWVASWPLPGPAYDGGSLPH